MGTAHATGEAQIPQQPCAREDWHPRARARRRDSRADPRRNRLGHVSQPRDDHLGFRHGLAIHLRRNQDRRRERCGPPQKVLHGSPHHSDPFQCRDLQQQHRVRRPLDGGQDDERCYRHDRRARDWHLHLSRDRCGRGDDDLEDPQPHPGPPANFAAQLWGKSNYRLGAFGDHHRGRRRRLQPGRRGGYRGEQPEWWGQRPLHLSEQRRESTDVQPDQSHR